MLPTAPSWLLSWMHGCDARHEIRNDIVRLLSRAAGCVSLPDGAQVCIEQQCCAELHRPLWMAVRRHVPPAHHEWLPTS